MSTATNAASVTSTNAVSACQTIHDLTGIRTSDPATWPDYGVKSLARGPQCSLTDRSALKGSRVWWKVRKSIAGIWMAIPSEGQIIYRMKWLELMRLVNAEIARRKRSADLGG